MVFPPVANGWAGGTILKEWGAGPTGVESDADSRLSGKGSWEGQMHGLMSHHTRFKSWTWGPPDRGTRLAPARSGIFRSFRWCRKEAPPEKRPAPKRPKPGSEAGQTLPEGWGETPGRLHPVFSWSVGPRCRAGRLPNPGPITGSGRKCRWHSCDSRPEDLTPSALSRRPKSRNQGTSHPESHCRSALNPDARTGITKIMRGRSTGIFGQMNRWSRKKRTRCTP